MKSNNENLKIKKSVKHKKSGVKRLIYNTKFLIVISALISVVIWVFVSLTDSTENQKTLNNIPINITLSDSAVQSGLKIYSGGNQTASVSVTGNRVAMGYVSNDDINVYAPNAAGTITTTGRYTLSLSARPADSMANFSIVSEVSPQIITVFADYEKSSTFEIKNKVKIKTPDEYYVYATLSSDKVSVTGPQSEVSKISYACIKGNIGDKLTDNYTNEYEIKLYDSSDNEISNSMIQLSVEKITATWTVNPIKEVPIKLNLENAPEDFDYSDYMTLSESVISISGSKETLDTIDSISTEPIDISTMSNKVNKTELKLEIPADCRNLSGIDTVKVKLDFSSFKTKSFQLDVSKQHNIENISDDYNCEVTTVTLPVTIVGPEYELEQLSSSDISCTIDLSDMEGNTTTMEHTALIAVDNSYNNCWASGEYKVNISISQKQ